MKKTISLVIAVLMIVMVMPFALLTVAAEGETPEIVDATIGGWFPETDKDRVMAFQSSNPGTNIYDGDITTDAQSEAYTNEENALKNAYFDVDGKFVCNQNEEFDGGYYHVIFLELNAKSAIDTLNLWADSGRNSEWAGPNGYDIWYSVDGETYTNSDLSFSGIRNETEVDPEIYVNDTFNGSACIAHHIDMDGVEAKYIAIAVTEFAYGSGSGQSIIYEVTVNGTIVEEPAAPVLSIADVAINAYTGSGNPIKWGSDNGVDLIIDGILHENNYASARNSKDEMGKWIYFDDNGAIAKADEANADYYAVAVVELSALADLNTLTIWSPNSIGGGWLDNAAYDIYYSVDGITFVPVDGATFADAISAHVNVPTSEFPGEATSGNSTGGIYKNVIDLTDIEAKYIAIAISKTLPDGFDGGRRQVVFYEMTVDGTIVEEEPAPETPTPEEPGEDNTDNENTGNENTGNENTGNENTGNENTGNENTGNENTGNENTGNENTGNENTGNENTGNENAGNENAGNENAGNENTDTDTNAPETEAPKAEEETEAEQGGCGSTLAMSGVALVGTCAAMLAIKRRKEDN